MTLWDRRLLKVLVQYSTYSKCIVRPLCLVKINKAKSLHYMPYRSHCLQHIQNSPPPKPHLHNRRRMRSTEMQLKQVRRQRTKRQQTLRLLNQRAYRDVPSCRGNGRPPISSGRRRFCPKIDHSGSTCRPDKYAMQFEETGQVER